MKPHAQGPPFDGDLAPTVIIIIVVVDADADSDGIVIVEAVINNEYYASFLNSFLLLLFLCVRNYSNCFGAHLVPPLHFLARTPITASWAEQPRGPLDPEKWPSSGFPEIRQTGGGQRHLGGGSAWRKGFGPERPDTHTLRPVPRTRDTDQ